MTVEAAVPVVQTETSERTATVTEKTLLELPNVGRNWFDVTGLLPGVNPGASGVGGTANNNGQDASVGGNYPYDLAPDGKRFAVVLNPAGTGEQEQRPTDSVMVLLNFFEELRRRRVPSGKD